MPTVEHDALIDVFRRHPELAPALLAHAFATPLPSDCDAVVVDAALGQLVPTEFRADLVIELRAYDGTPRFAIVLEVQRAIDPDKKYSWALYCAAIRARLRCPACVVVVAPDEGVAMWASQPIDMGLGRGIVSPIVLGPKDVPLLETVEAAKANPYLAMLSVIVHGDVDAVLPGAKGAVLALDTMDADSRADYFYVILSSLREPLRELLRRWMMGKDETQEEYIARFRPLLGKIADDLEARSEARSILRVLAARGLAVTAEQRALIERCTDLAVMDRWLERAATARSIDEVFA